MFSKSLNLIFPAWPKKWDVQFTLAARDTFLISASMEKGQIEFVEVHSQKAGELVTIAPKGKTLKPKEIS